MVKFEFIPIKAKFLKMILSNIKSILEIGFVLNFLYSVLKFLNLLSFSFSWLEIWPLDLISDSMENLWTSWSPGTINKSLLFIFNPVVKYEIIFSASSNSFSSPLSAISPVII